MNEKKLGFLEQILSLDTRFWIVNVMELLERLAYYGVRSVIAIYMVLPTELGGPGLTHIQKGTIFLWWAGFQSILPMFTGGYADRYGHKKTIAAAIIIKIIGYIMMGHFMSFWGFFSGCMLLAIGTAIFKPGVQGTLASTLKGNNASMGWGVFYQLVNIGGFLGPVLAGILRIMSWQYVFYACAIIVAVNFIWLPFYKDPSKDFHVADNMKSPLKVLITSIAGIFRPRVFFFCLAFSGFWLMFNQVFDLLPNVIDDWVDSSAIIGNIGSAFSSPIIPTVLAILLSIVLGGVIAALVFLSMRPDVYKTKEIYPPSYILVGLAICSSLYLLCQFFMTGMPLIITIVAIAIFITMALRKMEIHCKPIALLLGIVSTLSSFILLQSIFVSNAPKLVALSKQGAQVNPEWLINLNPGLIVFTMVFFGYLTSHVRPMVSILIGMGIATIGSVVAGTATFGWVCLAGIAIFSIGEMLSSPKKMEYLSTLAPPGQKGLFMGYANIPVAIGWMIGSSYAGHRYEMYGDKINLAKKYLIDALDMKAEVLAQIPRSEIVQILATKMNLTLLETQKLLFNTYHPEKIWYDIGLIGLGSIVLMIIYDRVIRYIDKKKVALDILEPSPITEQELT